MKYHLEDLDDSYPENHKKIVGAGGIHYADVIDDVVVFNGGSRFGVEFLRGIVEAVDENKKEKKNEN